MLGSLTQIRKCPYLARDPLSVWEARSKCFLSRRWLMKDIIPVNMPYKANPLPIAHAPTRPGQSYMTTSLLARDRDSAPFSCQPSHPKHSPSPSCSTHLLIKFKSLFVLLQAFHPANLRSLACPGLAEKILNNPCHSGNNSIWISISQFIGCWGSFEYYYYCKK